MKEFKDTRSSTLMIILSLGIILIVIGLAMLLSGSIAHGISTGGRGAPRAGTPININGYWAILFGIAIAFGPAFELLRRRNRG